MKPTRKTGLPLGIRKPLGNQAEFGGQGVLFCPLQRKAGSAQRETNITPKASAVN